MGALLNPDDIKNLSEEKQKLLHIIAKAATKIEKRGGKNPTWLFTFDEGVFQGQTILKLQQGALNPFAVLCMLTELNWPGFHNMVTKLQPTILRVLEEGCL